MKTTTPARLLAVALAFTLAGCGLGERADDAALSETDVAAALESFTAEDLLGHVEVLASDEFEGRAPGSAGEELTVEYLTDAFQQLGLAPGNPDGTYVQEVPLVGVRSRSTARITVGGEPLAFSHPDDYVTVSRHVVPQVAVQNSELVFAGYGVRAPEYDWDDFADADLAGKTLVVLVNDPPVTDPDDPSRLDPDVFNGEAMTYYGRWTYTYEIASELGAAAVLIVHETEPAGYPWEVVTGSWGGENFYINRPDGNRDRVPVEGWITRDAAERLFAAAGLDFEDAKRAALSRDFEPLALDARADFRVANETREVLSRNVIARLDGARPERRDEYVVYTAHWDHLGRDESREGDQIFNGALDNATGTGGLLQLARAFTAADTPPDRSIIFLAVTAEEQGLLGAQYYAENPLYPLERTLANINIDGLNQWGRTEDVVVVGRGMSTLEDLLEREAAAQGRVVVPDPEPEKGYYYRSDHFEFAKQGVPALYTDDGTRYIGKPEGYGEEKRAEYVANDYHKPSDEIKPDWDLSGAVEDLRLLFRVGYRVATADAWPEWRPGTEFRAAREEMLR